MSEIKVPAQPITPERLERIKSIPDELMQASVALVSSSEQYDLNRALNYAQLSAGQAIIDLLAKVQIKTLQEWEDGPEMSITDYLKPMDEVDEELFMHFAEVVPTQYHVGDLMQSGEAAFEDRGRLHYKTFAGYGEPTRYYYLGILPPFKQPK